MYKLILLILITACSNSNVKEYKTFEDRILIEIELFKHKDTRVESYSKKEKLDLFIKNNN